MADKQQNSSGVRYDPGSEISPTRTSLPVDGKNFIVGKFDDYGGKRVSGQPVDNTEVSRITKLMNQSMKTRGGEVMPGYMMTKDGPVKISQFTPKPISIKVVKSKKGKKIKLTETQSEKYLQSIENAITPEPEETNSVMEQNEYESVSVTFNIDSGTVRSSVDAILEDDLGLILVYNDLDSISYEPKRGGKLTLTLPNRTIQVMYLGIKCQWFNTKQQLLVFVKLDKE